MHHKAVRLIFQLFITKQHSRFIYFYPAHAVLLIVF